MNTSFSCCGETGSLALYDSAFRPAAMQAFLSCLNRVLDCEGISCAASGNEQRWKSIRKKEAKRLLKLNGEGRFDLILVGGDFHFPYGVKVCDQPLNAGERVRRKESFDRFINLPSGRMIVADAMTLFQEGFGVPPSNGKIIESGSGVFCLTIHHISPTLSTDNILGFFHKEIDPTVVIQLTAADENRKNEIPFPVFRDHLEESLQMSPGRRCYARVRRVEDSIVSLEIMLSEESVAGRARMPRPDGVGLNPGDIALVEDTRNFWWVRLSDR